MRNKLLFLILLSLVLTSSPAYSADPIIIQKGYSNIQKGYISSAIPIFEKAVKLFPQNPKAHLGLAIAAFKQGGALNEALAVKHFRRCLNLTPDNYEALTGLARILSWNTNTRDESINLYKKALKIKPSNNEIKYQLAEVLMWANKSDEASDLFASLYTQNPNDTNVILNYANALSMNNQYSKSLDLYKIATTKKIKFDPFSSKNYAKTLLKTNHPDVAIKIFNDLLYLVKDPKELTSLKKELAASLFDIGDYKDAIEVDLTIEPKTKDILLRMARSYQAMNNKSEAVDYFQMLYNSYPDDEEIIRSAAQYMTTIGGYNITAEKLYEELISAGMATLDDKMALANLYNSSDETKYKATSLFKDIIQDPDISQSQAEEIRLILARILASEDTTRTEAIQLYRQIIASGIADSDTQIEFAKVLSWNESTRKESLLKYYDLLSKFPNNKDVIEGFNTTLSWYLPSESDLDFYEEVLNKYPNNKNAIKGLDYFSSKYPESRQKIIEIYQKSINSNPDNIEMVLQLANLLAQSNETRKQALEYYKQAYKNSPEELDVIVPYANNLLYEKHFKIAKELYEKALEKSPENKEALLGIARIYGWQGLNLAAYKAYNQVYKIYPNDPQIAYEFATIAKKLGKNGKALEILRNIESQSLLPEPPVYAININMPMNCQATLQEDIDSSSADLDKLQQTLKEIQESLAKLQQSLNDLDNKADTEQISNHGMQYKESNITDTSEYQQNKNYSYQNDPLPEPKYPENFSGKVTYSTSPSPDILNQPVSVKDNTYDEVVLNPGSVANCFRSTGFENALSGSQYEYMMEQFGTLEKNIMYDLRPELRSTFTFSNEAGNPTSDGLETHGYPSYGSFNLTPQNRVRFGVTSMTYGMSPMVHPASITATSYTLGLDSRPHERVHFNGELSINSYSDPNAPVDVTARADLDLKLHDRLLLGLGYRREPLYQSVLEATGYTVQPQYNYSQLLNILALTSSPMYNPDNTIQYANLLADPNYYNALRGPFIGQVRDNAVNVELTYMPFNKWDITAGYEYSNVRGENVQHNTKHQALFNFGRTFTGVKDHLFRLGYQFLYFGYKRDLSGFPNMTPYPYMANGQLIPVSRQMPYEEALTVAQGRYAVPQDVYNFYTVNPVGTPFVPTAYQSPADLIRAPQGVGIGGYFCPTQFYMNSFRMDLEGKLFNGRIAYRGGGSLGVQNYGDRVDRDSILASRGLTNFNNIPANDPRRANPLFNLYANQADAVRDTTDPTSLAAAFDFTLFLKLTDFMTLYSGVDYLNAGAFDRWRYTGGLIFRPPVDALSPIFRKPGKSSSNGSKTEPTTENNKQIITPEE